MPPPQRHHSVDQLTQRASTGLAIRRGEIKISDPLPSSYVHNGPEMDYGAVNEQSTPKVEGVWPRRSGAATVHGRSESTTQQRHVSRFTERTSLGPSLAISEMSSVPSKRSTVQRKETGLRATIKRMFSKKDRDSTIQKRSMYQSDPGRVLSSNSCQSARLTRPSALHFSTVSPADALHSHAVSPHVRAESADNTPYVPHVTQLGTRRNTVPNLLTVQENVEPLVANMRIRDTAQRPTTAVERDEPSRPQFKRRSRSANGLADLFHSPRLDTSERQDRAGEIDYWRSSVLEDPIPRTEEQVTSGASMGIHEPTNPRDSSPSRLVQTSVEPIQDFDFGLNKGTDTIQPATLQERVNTLEVKLFDFEFALAKLQGNNIAKPNLPRRPLRRKPSRDWSASKRSPSATESSSTNDFSDLSTPSDLWQPPSPGMRQTVDRASKATTVKPVYRRSPSRRSQDSSRPSIHFTSEQYDTLFKLIEDEKAARHQLEVQVMNLQSEVDILRSADCIYGGPTKYPTPSPDSFRNTTAISGKSILLDRSPQRRLRLNLHETSRFSMTETESDTDAETEFPEIYETPQENNFRFESRSITPIQGNMI